MWGGPSESLIGEKGRETVTFWCPRAWQRACKMAQTLSEKLEQTKPDKKEKVALAPKSEQLARTPELPLPKGKGTRTPQ